MKLDGQDENGVRIEQLSLLTWKCLEAHTMQLSYSRCYDGSSPQYTGKCPSTLASFFFSRSPGAGESPQLTYLLALEDVDELELLLEGRQQLQLRQRNKDRTEDSAARTSGRLIRTGRRQDGTSNPKNTTKLSLWASPSSARFSKELETSVQRKWFSSLRPAAAHRTDATLNTFCLSKRWHCPSSLDTSRRCP